MSNLDEIVNGLGKKNEFANDTRTSTSSQSEAFPGDTNVFTNEHTREAELLPSIESLMFPTEETICPPDDRIKVTNTTDFPWRSVCRLIITLDDGRKAVGTGWLNGPGTVITAGHCVFDKNQKKWHKSIDVIPGKDNSKEPYGRFTVTTENFFSVLGWTRDGNEEYDYGALILNTKIGNTIGYWGFRYDPDQDIKDKTILNTGYPADKTGNMIDTQWYMKGKIDRLGPRKVYYSLDTFGGNSGGPVSLDTTNQAICIHAYGGCPNSGTRINQAVFNNLLTWKRKGETSSVNNKQPSATV